MNNALVFLKLQVPIGIARYQNLVTAKPMWPSFETWLYLWGIAILGTLAHYSWTKSCSMVEITSLQAIEFIKLPIMALFGWMIFSEIPGTWTWVGGLIIFMSTIYISNREAKATNSLKPITALRKQNSKGDL